MAAPSSSDSARAPGPALQLSSPQWTLNPYSWLLCASEARQYLRYNMVKFALNVLASHVGEGYHQRQGAYDEVFGDDDTEMKQAAIESALVVRSTSGMNFHFEWQPFLHVLNQSGVSSELAALFRLKQLMLPEDAVHHCVVEFVVVDDEGRECSQSPLLLSPLWNHLD